LTILHNLTLLFFCCCIFSQDLSFKERHWHEKCFKCSACTTSLADRPFATKEEQLYCSDCYDERFAARCDGCQGVFKAGMRKYEYRGQQWHEECFLCVECKQPIGAKSFIPRENQVVCVPCYEAKYAQRCTKCSEVGLHSLLSYSIIYCNDYNDEMVGRKLGAAKPKRGVNA
uniref:LIM zinc-binding domain-containing protein n=1 Tax=Schistosoma curassoni TaxID=6186 RepID=A0A183JW10_9TREM